MKIEQGRINFEYIGLIILAFFPIYPFFLLSVAIFIFVLLSIYSRFKYKNQRQNRSSILIFAHVFFYLLLIIRLLFLGQLEEGFNYLQPSLSLIVFPIVWYFSNTTLSKKERNNIFKYFTLSSFILGLYILGFSVYNSIKLKQEFTIVGENIKYLDIHSNYVSLYFLAAIIFLVLGMKENNTNRKIMGILLIGFFLFLIFYLSSRIVLITLFIVLFLDLFKRVKISFFKKGIIVLIGITLVLGSIFFMKPLQKKVKETFSTEEFTLPDKKFPTSLQIRLGVYSCTLPIIEDNWLLGAGVINFEEGINNCYSKFKNYDKIRYNSHNYYLFLLGSSGIFCLLSFVLLLYLHVKRALINKDFFYLYFIISIMITLLTENFLSRVYGVIFFLFFLTVFVKSNKREIKQNEK